MNNLVWVLTLAMGGAAWMFDHQHLMQRLREVEIKLGQLMKHVNFEPDMTPVAPSQEVIALARTPGKKIAAIKAYREQTGAGLREANDVVEAIEHSSTLGDPGSGGR